MRLLSRQDRFRWRQIDLPLATFLVVAMQFWNYHYLSCSCQHDVEPQKQAMISKQSSSPSPVPIHLDLWNDIQLLELLGYGAAVAAFRARVPKLGPDDFVVRFGDDLFYTAKEIIALEELNKEPTIPNIPKLYWSVNETRK